MRVIHRALLGVFVLMLTGCLAGDKEATAKDRHTLPFVLTAFNNIVFKATLNGTDTLNLKFDTGTTGLLLTHDAIKNKTHLLDDGTEQTPRQDYVPLGALATLDLRGLHWDSLEVFPVTHSGQGSDGRFGWDLFKDKVVLIDYDQRMMTIQDELPDTRGYTAHQFERVKSALCVSGAVRVGNKSYDGRFLFDSGYQKALLLDSGLANNLDERQLKWIKVNKLRNGAGKEFVTRVVMLDEIQLGDMTLQDIPAQLLNTANPATFETHILGNGCLKRFNTILDFKEYRVYLKPNSLIDAPYLDAD
jgi:hypothetical protein